MTRRLTGDRSNDVVHQRVSPPNDVDDGTPSGVELMVHGGFWTRHEYWQALNALATRIDSSTEAPPAPVPAEGERLGTSTPLSAGMELYRLPGSGE